MKDQTQQKRYHRLLNLASTLNPFSKIDEKSGLKLNRFANILLSPILIKKLIKIENEYKSSLSKLDLSKFKDKIEDYKSSTKLIFSLDLEEAIGFLSTIVSINTTNSQNGDTLLKFFEYYLRKLNYLPTKIITATSEGIVNKAYLWEKDKNNPWVIINTHYDVIPSKGWTSAFDPKLSIEEDGLFLYGRGSNDNKFGFLAFLLALNELMKLNLNICFAAVGDEEKGGERGTSILLSRVFNHLNGKQIVGVVLEPTYGFPNSLKIGVRKKADLLLHMNAGEFKPTSHKDGGLIDFIYYISKLSIDSRRGKAIFNSDERLKGLRKEVVETHTIMSIKSLEVYESIGTNPGRGKLHLFFRFFPEKDFSSIESIIRKFADKTGVEFSSIAKKIDDKGFIDDHFGFQKTFTDSINTIIKLLKFKGSAFRTIGGGGSDAKYFHDLSIPVVEFGITPYNLHSRNERADIMDIYISALILIKALHNYSKLANT